jgi:hypothetical protein
MKYYICIPYLTLASTLCGVQSSTTEFGTSTQELGEIRRLDHRSSMSMGTLVEVVAKSGKVASSKSGKAKSWKEPVRHLLHDAGALDR